MKPTYSLKAPLISTFIFMLGHGPYNTFFGLDLASKGVPVFTQGIIHSIFFLGLLLGPFYMEKIIPKFGHIRMFASCSALYAASISLQGLTHQEIILAMARFLSGYSLAAICVIIESWLMLVGGKEERGKALSYYMVVVYLGVSLGQLLLNQYKPNSMVPYLMSLLFTTMAIIPVSLTLKQAPTMPTIEVEVNSKRIFKEAFFGSFGMIIAGLIVSNLYTLIPVYFSTIGLDVRMGMFIIILSGGIFQYPVGKFSDTHDRSLVIFLLSFLLLILSFIAYYPELLKIGPIFFFFCILLGTLTFSLYPTCMAQVCDRYQEEEIVKVTAFLMILYGLGSTLGPAVSGIFMSKMGNLGLIISIQFFTVLLIVIGHFHSVIHKPIPQDDKIAIGDIPADVRSASLSFNLSDSEGEIANP